MNVDFEKYLQLEDDLRRYRKALNEALEIMLDQEVSNYPIFILHQQEKVLLNCRLIGNRVQITNCRATVSNASFLPNYIHCTPKAYGKDGKNVTSQETCLYRIDSAFAN